MVQLDAFERAFILACQERKNKGGEINFTWGEVKTFIKEERLLSSDELRDNKDVLKARAAEIATEIMNTDNSAQESPRSSPKASSRKRKADLAHEEETRSKKMKTTNSRKWKKDVVPSDMEAPKVAKRSQKMVESSSKRIKAKAMVNDEKDEEPDIHTKLPVNSMRRVSSSVDSDETPPKSPDVVRDSNPNDGVKEKTILAAGVAELSDAELSMLEDESPAKPKRKNDSKKRDPGGKKGLEKGKSAKVKAKTAEDSAEEQIKKLKSFVSACGVRKKWVKEFEGIEDNPKKQILRLKHILEGLGMTGRLSMDKAKAIRAKRELEEEIQEAVQFEARRGAGDGRLSRSRTKKETTDDDDEAEDEEKLGANPPVRKKTNPLAFLDDQTDEE